MNQLLFDRSTGSLGPNVFAKLQTARLLSAFRPEPRLRFDGGEKGNAIHDNDEGEGALPVNEKHAVWAHQSGVNALALERFDGRLYVYL